jgi:hypothetical protein
MRRSQQAGRRTMPMYIFYPCLADGSSTSFEAVELADDRAVHDRARTVLERHASATHVKVWREGEPVDTIRRNRSRRAMSPAGSEA